MTTEEIQKLLCHAHGVRWMASPDTLKVAVARNVRSEIVPVHGLRIPPKC